MIPVIIPQRARTGATESQKQKATQAFIQDFKKARDT